MNLTLAAVLAHKEGQMSPQSLAPVKKWMGGIPKECDICHGELGKTFTDGHTPYGWAIMCKRCHKAHGSGLGVGRGQEYNLKTLEKVGG